MIKYVTIGSDPEHAAVNSLGEPKSVIGLLPGTKKEPHPLAEGTSCQVDCVGTEFCIPPCTSADEFLYYMNLAKNLTQAELNKLAPDLKLVSVSSARYNEDELAPIEARTFGCEPSYCVYDGKISPRPSPRDIGNLRSFGFHIHIGYETVDNLDAIDAANRLIRAMDIQCGLGSVIIDRDADRRSLYGNAGDLRFRQIRNPNYTEGGDRSKLISIVEYRTLGGYMHSSDELLSWVFNQTLKAVDMANNWKESYDELGIVIEDLINNGDIDGCLQLCNDFGITLPSSVNVNINEAVNI